MVLWNDEADPI